MPFDPRQHLMKVKGNAEYLEVKWRLVWFREQWPNGVMETEPIEISPEIAIFRAKVTAIDENGNVRGSATGYKTCTPAQFKFGYVEKAETGALGRALACLGFGTQFEPEFDESEDFIADSPVETKPDAPRGRPVPPPLANVEKSVDAARQIFDAEDEEPQPSPRRGRPVKRPTPAADAAPADEAPRRGRPIPKPPATINHAADPETGELTPASEKQRDYIRGLWKQLGYTTEDGHTNMESLEAWLRSDYQSSWETLTMEEAKRVIEDLLKAKDMASVPV